MKDYLEIDSMPVSRMTNAEFHNYMDRVPATYPAGRAERTGFARRASG